MDVPNMNCDGQSVYLFLFSAKSFFQKKLTLYGQEEIKVTIDAKVLMTISPLLFRIRRVEREWLIDDMPIGEEGYCFLKSKGMEQVLLVPVAVKDTFGCCKVCTFTKEKVITVGDGFREVIFYEYASFTKEQALLFYREKTGYFLEINKLREETNARNVYVNGKSAEGKVVLSKGDCIVMLGLSILVLPDMLLCTSFFGTLRMTEGNSGIALRESKFLADKRWLSSGGLIEELVIEEKMLHREEIEIVSPQPEQKEHKYPLLLTLGPSATMIVPAILMAAMGSVSEKNSYYMITVAMTMASAGLSVFWGLLNYHYRHCLSEREERCRKENYRRYLQEIRTYLEKARKENQQILWNRYPHYSNFIPGNQQTVKVSYERNKGNDEGKFLRMGLGETPFQIQLKLQSVNRMFVQDVLLKEAEAVYEEYQKIKDVPVGISFKEGMCIGFAGKHIFPVLRQFLFQLAAGYSSEEMKIVYFYHEEYLQERQLAECLKWLPHTWQEGRRCRFLAGNNKEAGEIIPVLENIWSKKKENAEYVRYMVLLADSTLLEGESISSLLKVNDDVGINVCYVEQSKELLPGYCHCLVLQEDETIIQKQEKTVITQKVNWEICEYRETEKYMRSLTGMYRKNNRRTDISNRVSFLDLYDCDRVEDLNCQSKWQENRTEERIRVPIGIGEGGKKVFLDIHEKFHGPHGLIAGTTGSGKSELLQTYLLSLAVSFSPDDVNFFIIDYKGGGMGDVLADLPHCSGVISNLSGRQIKRALISIKSENLRRQSLLSQNKISHVEEYQKLYREGKVTESMPHLLLVVDEFAELKREEPEFMQEIISISQVGRSLGVHLILSTQKPAGCVDDKIWSNTRFRLCLRVADRQDSMDMLHRPDAAYLTEAGRGYMQVGNDEMFLLFQAGYCKAPYLPGSRNKAETALLSATGQRLVLPKGAKQEQKKQLVCIRDYIQNMAKRICYQRARELWVPELADTIILKEAVGNDAGICIGVCDDPKQQSRFPLFYQQQSDGHLCLCAGPATGKSTFLQTFLWQLSMQHSPQEVQFVIAASDAAGVNCFDKMPHCLGNMKNSRDAECFFYHLEQFFIQRKALLGGISLTQYQKRQSQKIPILFLVIDNYGNFRRMTQDKYEELIEKIAAEGLSYGIYLVITALSVGGNEVPSKLFEKIKTTFALELSDRVHYGDVMRKYRLDVLPKEGVKGRGLCKVGEEILEMQIPLFSGEDDYGRIEEVEKQCKRIEMQENGYTTKFPAIPEKADYEGLLAKVQEKGKSSLPLGYLKNSGLIELLSLSKNAPFIITGGPESGKKSLLLALLWGCRRLKKEVVIYDRKGDICAFLLRMPSMKENQYHVIRDEGEWKALHEKLNKQEKDIVFAVGNLADFANHFPFSENMPFMLIISRPEEEPLLMGNLWYRWLMTKQSGICLGGHAGEQRLLNFEDLGYEHMSRGIPPGWGYLKKGGRIATKHLYLPPLAELMSEQEGIQ